MRKFLDQNRNFPIQLLEETRIDFPIESAHYGSRFFFSIELFKYCGLVFMCKYALLIIIWSPETFSGRNRNFPIQLLEQTRTDRFRIKSAHYIFDFFCNRFVHILWVGTFVQTCFENLSPLNFILEQ